MPRYYFDVFDGVGMLADAVGDEFADDKAAADQAVSLIPALADDHIPEKHDLTVATSLRNDDGAVIHRSVGLVRSQWSDSPDTGFFVTVDGVTHSIADTRRLREETRELREKIRANISDIFRKLESLAAMSEIYDKKILG